MSSTISYTLLMSILFIILAKDINAAPTNGSSTRSSLRGMFVFGSSVVDNGNNNALKDDNAKANYYPYGVDFPSGPTGRFSNGKNVVDLISDHLHLPYPPPFSGPRLVDVHGANFGSGGSGIQDNIGTTYGSTSMNDQIKKFKNEYLPKLEKQHGIKGKKRVAEYLFLVAAGNNDYSYYYYSQQHNRSTVTPMVYAANLISQLSDQLKELYDVGARKFLLLSVYPVGCSPTNAMGKGCIQLNEAIELYHDLLLVFIKHKNQLMPEAQFSVVNSGKILTDLIKFAHPKGFNDVRVSCCEIGKGGGSCKRGTHKICTDRRHHVFYDNVHLTEAASGVIAAKAYYSSPKSSDVYPVNLQTLAHVEAPEST